MQTYIGEKATSWVNNRFKTEISIGNLDLVFPFQFNFHNTLILDHMQDTLLYAQNLKLGLLGFDRDFSEFNINYLKIDDAEFNLIHYPEDSLNNLSIFLSKFSSETDSSETKIPVIYVGDLMVENLNFKYHNFLKSPIDSIIDFNHLETTINLNLVNANYDNEILVTQVKKLELKEKSGFEVSEFYGELFLNSTKIYFRDLHLKTPNSNLAGNFKILHGKWGNYSNFIEDVPLNFYIKQNSNLNLIDVGYFTSIFYDKSFNLKLNGQLNGTIDNIQTKNFYCAFGDRSFFKANLKMLGLPNIFTTYFNLDFSLFEIYPEDINQLIEVFSPKTLLPEFINSAGKIQFDGNLMGFLSDLIVEGDFLSSLGDLYSDVELKLNEDYSGSLNGSFRTIGLSLKTLFPDVKEVNEIAFNGKFKGEFSNKNFSFDVNSLFPFIDLNGYRYKDLNVKGKIENKSFQGMMNIYDPNLQMVFNGKLDFNKQKADYLFSSAVTHANLTALNLINNGKENSFSGSVFIDIEGSDFNNLDGQIILGNLYYKLDSTKHRLKSLQISANQNDSGAVYLLKSDNIDADLTGEINFQELYQHLNFEVYTALPYLYNEAPQKPKSIEDFSLNLKFLRPTFISQIFYPDLVINDAVDLQATFNSEIQLLKLKLDAPSVSYNNFKSENSSLEFTLADGILDGTGNSKTFYLGDSLRFENLLVKGKSVGNKLQTDISWATNLGTASSGNISALIDFLSEEQIVTNFFNTSFTVEGSTWKLNDENEIAIIDSNIYFKNLDLINEIQKFSVFGSISTNPETPLHISFENFDLKTFNDIIKSNQVRVDGLINGTAQLKNFYKNPIFSADFQTKELAINQQDFGKGNIRAIWNKTNQKITTVGRISNSTGQVIDLKGDYYPYRKEDALDLTLDFKNLGLKFTQSFLVDFISDLDGIASGKVIAKGKLSEPVLEGNLNLKETRAKVDYLNSTYYIKNENFVIEPDWMGFNYITITDERGKEANSVGTIFHENYSNFNFDIILFTENFQMLNTTSKQNSLYYGKAFGSGDINVSGFSDNLTMEINIASEKGTELFIPLSGPNDVNSSGYISYVSSWDETEKVESNKLNLKGIQMDFNLEVNDNAEVQLIFDETVGDIMKAKGDGNLQMKINTNGEFLMYGEYAVTEGDYLFTLENIINKRFKVKKGGTITWNGDPYEAKLDLTAIYKTRSSLEDLGLPIDSSAARRKVPVEVDLAMKNNFLSPDLTFGIRLPNSDDNTQTLLNSVIQTEEELNKQVFSLMIMNRFSPPQSGLQTGGAVGATSTELLANQLTNWLSKSKLNDIVEIGVSELSADEVQLALSKRLFNDRVIIEGSFGSTSSTSADGIDNSQSNNIVGDFNVEYSIKKDGKLKARAYRKSNDFNMVNNNYSPYTEGIGLFYREDFDTWKIYFKKLFNKREKD